MMAATQPFLSGAISKTVNLPQDCSVDDIAEAYLEAWRQGIKAVAIYRDNSKGTQPLNVTAQTDADKKGTKACSRCDRWLLRLPIPTGFRRRLRRLWLRRLRRRPGRQLRSSRLRRLKLQIRQMTEALSRRTLMRWMRRLRRALCGIVCRQSAPR